MNPRQCADRGCSERARAQRERILAAARQCFVQHGFHAAGMALIAETAGMSPGLIYRYFANKNAIILAIVEQEIEESRAGICALRDAEDLAQGVFEAFINWRDATPCTMNAALFLEMSVEGTRELQLGQALSGFDRERREEIVKWLLRDAAGGGLGYDAQQAEVKALGLMCFVEGLAIRAVREPGLAPEMVKAAIDDYVAGMQRH